MKPIHTRMMLKRLNPNKYNLEPTFNELKELERLAEIGEATEKALKKPNSRIYFFDSNGFKKVFLNSDELIKWAVEND